MTATTVLVGWHFLSHFTKPLFKLEIVCISSERERMRRKRARGRGSVFLIVQKYRSRSKMPKRQCYSLCHSRKCIDVETQWLCMIWQMRSIGTNANECVDNNYCCLSNYCKTNGLRIQGKQMKFKTSGMLIRRHQGPRR